MNARKSAPGVEGFKPYLSSEDVRDDVESGMSVLDFFPFGEIPPHPPYRRADEDQCVVRRAAANVASNIIRPR